MRDIKLPPLPEPKSRRVTFDNLTGYVAPMRGMLSFDEAQAYARQAVLMERADKERVLALQQASSYKREIDSEIAAERERCAQICDKLRDSTLLAQFGNRDELSNVMLRQVAELGHRECAAAIREQSLRELARLSEEMGEQK